MRAFGMAAIVVAGVVTLGAARRGNDAAAAGGTVTGTIKFTGARPVMAKIDMSDEATCKAKYPAAPTKEDVVVNTNGTLDNVFVYVKSGLPASYQAPAPGKEVVLDQNGCRYHPHVFGVMVGQTIEIKNSDGIAHNIKAKGVKNRPFNISQPNSMTTERSFSTPEVMVPLECNVHGWMNAWVGVVANPFFAVSDATGKFTISGLPAGTYVIEAWQEKYGTQTATVTVPATGTKQADFTFAAK